jgi:anti-sigma regulatory factor (Ser/Thr protein kinase)
VAAARLSPEPPSAARARRFVEETLARWQCDDLLDTVKLLVSELVGNAVAYTGSEVEVSVKLLPDRLRIEVADESADWLRRRTTSGDSVSGRGIEVVETLAESWGVAPRRGGKAVWFELPRPAGPAAPAAPGAP